MDVIETTVMVAVTVAQGQVDRSTCKVAQEPVTATVPVMDNLREVVQVSSVAQEANTEAQHPVITAHHGAQVPQVVEPMMADLVPAGTKEHVWCMHIHKDIKCQ
jgi:hypothetical protein